MAKLHFFFSVMASGKSSHLLQAAFNFSANMGNVMLFTSVIDDRYKVGKITSRIGMEADATPLGKDDNVAAIVAATHARTPVTAVLIDEVQFMTSDQMRQAADIADNLGIPVMAYGLKNNFLGELFSDSIATLLALADQIQEIKQVCHCGRKATMILKYGTNGMRINSGEIVEIGGEDRYVSVCRPHWTLGDIGPAARSKLLTSS